MYILLVYIILKYLRENRVDYKIQLNNNLNHLVKCSKFKNASSGVKTGISENL